MERNLPQRVRGTKDFVGPEKAAMERLQSALTLRFAAYGYQAVDTPVLEPAELYFRKSGGEMMAMTYTFTDPGGRRLSLRPEFTASVVRAYIERSQELTLPVRWQYCGAVFRHQPQSKYRQFTQLGVELIGAGTPEADAEVLSLVSQGAAVAGLRECRLVVGHLGIALDLLEALGLSDRVKGALLNSMGDLSREDRGRGYVREVFQELGLLQETRPKLHDLLRGLDEEEGKRLIMDLLGGDGEPFTGSRDAEEVAARFWAKIRRADPPEAIERALELMADLCRLRGNPRAVLAQARAILDRHCLDMAPLQRIATVLRILEPSGVRPTLDLGLARGLSYYTGIVFELYHPLLPQDQPLCGGGRYDGLVRALGGPEEVPALGFAFSLEQLQEALDLEQGERELTTPRQGILMLAQSPASFPLALEAALALRDQGSVVEMEVLGRDLSQGLAYAEAKGLAEVVVIDDRGYLSRHRVGGSE